MENNGNNSKINTSYNNLRSLLGWGGIVLPIMLVVWNKFELRDSVSQFFYSHASPIFVGFMVAFGMFMLAYKGYPKEQEEKISDNFITNFAGIMAILTALNPPEFVGCAKFLPADGHMLGWRHNVHLLTAGSFFAATGIMSYFKFTLAWKRNKHKYKSERLKLIKQRKDMIFRVCAWGIWISLALMIISVQMKTDITGWDIDIFLLETIGAWFFGVAWFTVAAKDPPDEDPKP